MQSPADKWLSVSQLTGAIKRSIEQNPGLQKVWLRGEISNFKKHSRGHMYFTLKDEQARISAVMFAGKNKNLSFLPENGMKVLVTGSVSVYEPFGQYQMYVNAMEPDGIGQLYVRFEQLKKQLEAEGLFAAEYKRPLPPIPRHIVVITSPTGAAIRDIVSTLKRRFPPVKITLFPVLVQGEQAPGSITRALERVEKMNSADVVIVGRGGGSIEDLWAFNEEVVARAIRNVSVPVISAVGHETDVTIADFTADVRAATPTAAAEIAVPMISELEEKIRQLQNRLHRQMNYKLQEQRTRFAKLRRSYAFKYPARLFEQKEQDLDRMMERLEKQALQTVKTSRQKLEETEKRLMRQHPERLIELERERMHEKRARLQKAMNQQVERKKATFAKSLQALELLNPLAILQRGYNVAYDENDKVLSSIAQADEGSSLRMYMTDGYLQCEVKEKGEDGFEALSRPEKER